MVDFIWNWYRKSKHIAPTFPFLDETSVHTYMTIRHTTIATSFLYSNFYIQVANGRTCTSERCLLIQCIIYVIFSIWIHYDKFVKEWKQHRWKHHWRLKHWWSISTCSTTFLTNYLIFFQNEELLVNKALVF